MLRPPLRSDALAANALFVLIAAYLLIFTVSPLFTYEITQILKYVYTVLLVVMSTWCLLTFFRFNPNPAFLIAPFLLSVIGTFTFIMVTATTKNPITYASALIPLLTAAVPLFLPDRAVSIDVPRLLRWLLVIFLISGAFHIFAQSAQGSGGGGIDYRVGHEDTFIILSAAILAGVRRDRRLFAVAFLFAVTSLVLRPSSTLAISLVITSLYVWAHWIGWGRLAVAAAFWMMVTLVVMNSLIIFDVPVVDVMFRIEPWIKEEVLGSTSNNTFRIAVLEAAIDDFRQESIIFGTFFSGDVNVYVRHLLPFFGDIAPIHNDFVNATAQGGIIGALLFGTIFIGLGAAARTGLGIARAIRDPSMAAFFSSAIAANLLFVIYIGFNPAMRKIELGLFYLIWIPLSVFALRQLKSRVARGRPMPTGQVGPGRLAPVTSAQRHV